MMHGGYPPPTAAANQGGGGGMVHHNHNHNHNHPQTPTHHLQQQQQYQQQYQQQQQQQQQHFQSSSASTSTPPSSMSQMTLDQVRQLHAHALSEAEAKRTELRLVVTSRYKELVGSSDEVTKMQRQATKLNDVVSSMPDLLTKLIEADRAASEVSRRMTQQAAAAAASPAPANRTDAANKPAGTAGLAGAISSNLRKHRHSPRYIRGRLSVLPRRAHGALDDRDPHAAALALVEAFTLISYHDSRFGGGGGRYPLAEALSVWKEGKDGFFSPGEKESKRAVNEEDDEETLLLTTQAHMVYLHIQCLPAKTVELARAVLLEPSPPSPSVTAGAIAALALLDPGYEPSRTAAARLLDAYYDSKSKLLSNLLGDVERSSASSSNKGAGGPSSENGGDAVDELTANLQSIVRVIQRDIVLDSGRVFLRMLRGHGGGTEFHFDPDVVRSKCSRFLAAHLPLLKSRMRTILSSVSTASYLATIRQALYDQTTGKGSSGVGGDAWEGAVREVVDLPIVINPKTLSSSSSRSSITGGGASTSSTTAFSLWTILFSQTFDSLVEGLLRHSCASLHSTVITSLRRSLALAPPHTQIRAHEAHRNCLLIASTLDRSLRKLNDDAWKLVHAEERDVSSVALRQSLFVQTCETLARILCDLRLMCVGFGAGGGEASTSTEDGGGGGGGGPALAGEAGRGLIVGRLCYLLKYRLSSLRTLLDPSAAPSGGGAAAPGTITVDELRSAFEINDDDDDGLLSLDGAREAMEAAFSGGAFGGADAVGSMLSFPSSSSSSSLDHSPRSLTFLELVLLATRGLRHGDRRNNNNALVTIQSCLDSIVAMCFQKWGRIALSHPSSALTADLAQLRAGWSVSPEAWLRLHGCSSREGAGDGGRGMMPSDVSSSIVAFLLQVSSELNRVICPKDFLLPVGSVTEAESLGVYTQGRDDDGKRMPPTLVDVIRLCLLRQAFHSLYDAFKNEIAESTELDRCCDPCLLQLMLDLGFTRRCLERCQKLATTRRFDDGPNDDDAAEEEEDFDDVALEVENIRTIVSVRLVSVPLATARSDLLEREAACSSSCDLFLSSLFDDDMNAELGSSASTDVTSSVVSGGASGSTALNPMASSRRFVLLPIQSEQRQLSELQLESSRQASQGLSAGGSVAGVSSSGSVSATGGTSGSGFGFFTSMKWKK